MFDAIIRRIACEIALRSCQARARFAKRWPPADVEFVGSPRGWGSPDLCLFRATVNVKTLEF